MPIEGFDPESFSFENQSDEFSLIRWTKELPSGSTQDPLGLNLRVSARLAAELLHCITSITPRARYYAFFPWAIADYTATEKGRSGDRGQHLGVVTRERAMVLGAILHHGGAPCEDGALGGSNRATVLATTDEKSFDLSAWMHLDNAEGQFGAAYKASIINLGIFDAAEQQVDEEVDPDSNQLPDELAQVDFGLLSSRGHRLAEAFSQSVAVSRYVAEDWTAKSDVPRELLEEFGARAGVCEIGNDGAFDKEVLRDIFFSCDREDVESAHYRRRMSLLLLLDSIRAFEKEGVHFDEDTFSDRTYFQAVLIDDNDEDEVQAVALAPLPELNDIAERWRVFHFHGYLSLALQSMLVFLVRTIRGHDGGIDRKRLFDLVDGRTIWRRVGELLDRDLSSDFLEMSPAQTVEALGLGVGAPKESGQPPAILPELGSGLSERKLSDWLLNKDEANQIGGLGLATVLLYVILFRYRSSVGGRYDAWYRNHVTDPTSDISLSGLAEWLDDTDVLWLDKPNREILDRIFWKYLVLQHQRMSFERGFGGSAPLFHLDGTTIIGTDSGYIDPTPLNARLPAAQQILVDLGLLCRNEDRYPCITSDGRVWLQKRLSEERAS